MGWESIPLGDDSFKHLRIIRDSEAGTIVATVPEPYADAIKALPELREISRKLLAHLQNGGLTRTDPELVKNFAELLQRTETKRGSRRNP